jgi:hypothetical protein
MDENIKMKTPRTINLPALVAVLLILLSCHACKAPPTDRMGSSLKTLDNFATADGEFTVNECSGERSASVTAFIVAKTYLTQIVVPTDKSWAAADLRAVYTSIAAVPPGILSVFFDGLKGVVQITPESDKICKEHQRLSAGENARTSPENSDQSNKFHGCWFMDAKGPKIVVNSELTGGKRKWILHSLVREFGYFTAEHLAAWNFVRRPAETNETNAWYWELTAKKGPSELDGEFVTALGKAFEKEIKSAMVSDPSKHYSLQQYEKNPNFKNSLSKWIFAEAFDSYFCSSKTEEKFRIDFPETYKIFDAHFKEHRGQLGQLALTAETEAKKGTSGTTGKTKSGMVKRTVKTNSKDPGTAKEIPVEDQVAKTVEDPVAEVDTVPVKGTTSTKTLVAQPVEIVYEQEPEQQVVYERNSGNRYVYDRRDEDTGCSFCGITAGIGRGLLGAGMGFLSTTAGFGYGGMQQPYQNFPPQIPGNCNWPGGGGGVSGNGGFNPMGQPQYFQGGQFGQPFNSNSMIGENQAFPNQPNCTNNQQQQNSQWGQNNQFPQNGSAQQGCSNNQVLSGNQQNQQMNGNQQSQNGLVSNQFAGCGQNQNQQLTPEQLAKQEEEKQRALQQAAQAQVQPSTPAPTPSAYDSGSSSGSSGSEVKPVVPARAPVKAKAKSGCGIGAGAEVENTSPMLLFLSVLIFALFL